MRQYYLPLATLILLVAAALRVVGLEDYPPGPHYDEAVNVMITRSIAFGGARFFPIVESFQGREVLYYYLSTPFFWWIHDGRFSLQLVSVLSNLILVATTIALGPAMFGNTPRGRLIGLAAGVIAAISLPQILLARQAFRAIVLPACQGLALLFVFRGLRATVGWRWLLAGGVFAGLAVYTYNSSRLFPVWLALAGLALLFADRARFRQGLVFFGVLAVVALPMAVYAVREPEIFLGRLYEVTESQASVTLLQSVRLHLDMFFLQGESLLRYNPRGRPYFTILEGFALCLGYGVCLWRVWRAGAIERAAYTLLLLAPFMVLPSIISTGGLPPNHMRSIAMAPLIFLVIGVGLWPLLSRVRQFAWLFLFAGLAAGSAYTAADYRAWVTRADLYYDTDADLAAAGEWMRRHDDGESLFYVAAQDRFHPTLQIANTPDLRWLGADTILLPPPGRTGILVFPRSAPPPEELQDWLAMYRIEDVPLGPDARPAFDVFRLTHDVPLPDDIEPVEDGPRNAFLRLSGVRSTGGFPAARPPILTVWDVQQTPPAERYLYLLHFEDDLGTVLHRSESLLTGLTELQPGEVLIHRQRTQVPIGTPPGSYPLQVAWVERDTDIYTTYLAEQGGITGVWAQVGTFEVARPGSFPPPDSLPVDVRAELDVAAGVRLLGWLAPPETARPGESLLLTLQWHAIPTERPRESLTFEVMLVDTSENEVRLLQSDPVRDAHSSDGWVDGELITGRLRVDIPREQAPGDYRIVLNTPRESIELGTLEIGGVERAFTAPDVEQRVQQTFGGAVGLHGYTVQRRDDALEVSVVWEALRAVQTDYTIFVHLVDSETGEIVDQRDQMPLQNTYPTTLWLPGEFVTDTFVFPEPDRPVDQIRIGFYDASTGRRLPSESTEEIRQDFYTISIKDFY